MTNTELVSLAKDIANKAGLDPALFCAIVEQESNWNPWAIRYEPAFYERYVKPLNLNPSESQARSFSWGLTQLMGEVARELGYKAPYLSSLCDPETGLTLGAKHFSNKLARAEGDVTQALLYWNGGSNKAYPDQVLARVDKYKGAL